MVVVDMRRSQQMPSAASVSSRNVALGACSAAAVGVSRTATVRQRSATAWSSAPNWRWSSPAVYGGMSGSEYQTEAKQGCEPDRQGSQVQA